MNTLTQQVLEQLKEIDDFSDKTALQHHFEAVLDAYLIGNYPEGYDGGTLMCSIHDSYAEESGHNCLGCNLEEQSKLLTRFLARYESFADTHEVGVYFHLLLYLLATRYNEYIDMMEIPEAVKHRNFGVFQKVLHWANFIKHPKAFVLVHHPQYYFDEVNVDDGWQRQQVENARKYKMLIDDDFVAKFYAGGQNNGKLFGALSNKEGVVVMFPNPLKLITAFVKAQQEFVSLIEENKVFREIIGNKGTLKAIFTNED